MTTAEWLALFRLEMSDASEPFLWSDVEVYGFADDAQKMFCRLTDGIADATSLLTSLVYQVDDEWVDLSPLILKIRDSVDAATGAPITVVNQEDMPGLGLRFDGRTGPARVLIVGMEENKARIYPRASLAGVMQLSVFRLPLVPIVSDADAFEIGEQHHRHLLLWAKHLALLKQDAETFDKNKAQEMEARFRAYCALAKQEQGNKRHKVRVVSYGGV